MPSADLDGCSLQDSRVRCRHHQAAIARADAAGLAAAVEDAVGLVGERFRRAGRIPGPVDTAGGLAGMDRATVDVERLEDAPARRVDIGPPPRGPEDAARPPPPPPP